VFCAFHYEVIRAMATQNGLLTPANDAGLLSSKEQDQKAVRAIGRSQRLLAREALAAEAGSCLRLVTQVSRYYGSRYCSTGTLTSQRCSSFLGNLGRKRPSSCPRRDNCICTVATQNGLLTPVKDGLNPLMDLIKDL
jgi:hypothetical protein